MTGKDFKLFTIGPCQMYPRTLEVRAQPVPYFRTAQFSDLMLESERLLKKLQGAQDDAELIVLTASGSGAMEATVINCFDVADRLLVVDGGSFGHRFVRICEIHGIPHDVVKLGSDEALTAERLEVVARPDHTGLLVNLCETSTGQLYDLDMLSAFCESHGLILVVDAISSFLADPYDATAHGVDATIVSSQKGLCLAPGLSFVTLSPRMVERVNRIDPASLYFDFSDYIQNMKRGQTPFTPAVGVCFELNDALHAIDDQGLDNRLAEVRQRASHFRTLLEDLPADLPPFLITNAITPVRFRADIATDLFNHLKDEKDLVVNPSGGELGKRSIRVAHVGDLALSDYDELVEAIKAFIQERVR